MGGWKHIPACANGFGTGYPVHALAILLWETHAVQVPTRVPSATLTL